MPSYKYWIGCVIWVQVNCQRPCTHSMLTHNIAWHFFRRMAIYHYDCGRGGLQCAWLNDLANFWCGHGVPRHREFLCQPSPATWQLDAWMSMLGICLLKSLSNFIALRNSYEHTGAPVDHRWPSFDDVFLFLVFCWIIVDLHLMTSFFFLSFAWSSISHFWLRTLLSIYATQDLQDLQKCRLGFVQKLTAASASLASFSFHPGVFFKGDFDSPGHKLWISSPGSKVVLAHNTQDAALALYSSSSQAEMKHYRFESNNTAHFRAMAIGLRACLRMAVRPELRPMWDQRIIFIEKGLTFERFLLLCLKYLHTMVSITYASIGVRFSAEGRGLRKFRAKELFDPI